MQDTVQDQKTGLLVQFILVLATLGNLNNTDKICGSHSLSAHGVPNTSIYFFHNLSPLRYSYFRTKDPENTQVIIRGSDRFRGSCIYRRSAPSDPLGLLRVASVC